MSSEEDEERRTDGDNAARGLIFCGRPHSPSCRTVVPETARLDSANDPLHRCRPLRRHAVAERRQGVGLLADAQAAVVLPPRKDVPPFDGAQFPISRMGPIVAHGVHIRLPFRIPAETVDGGLALGGFGCTRSGLVLQAQGARHFGGRAQALQRDQCRLLDLSTPAGYRFPCGSACSDCSQPAGARAVRKANS